MIDIVTHCYSIENPCYAAYLNYQLSSLVLHPTKCDVLVTIVHVIDDILVQNVIKYFSELGKPNIRTITLSKEDLGQRAIGRNIAAKTSNGDIVWFTDVDHVFHEPCLDDLNDLTWDKNNVIVYPKRIQIQKDHKLGDETANAAINNIGLLEIKTNDFTRKTYTKAVGGVQIVKGDFVRKHGYLDKVKKWLIPKNTPFKSFRDDMAFRIFCLNYGAIVPINLSGVYRLRHTCKVYL